MYNIFLIILSFLFLLYFLFKSEWLLLVAGLGQIVMISFFSIKSGHLFITNLVELSFFLTGLLSIRLVFFNSHLPKEFRYYINGIIVFFDIYLFFIIGNMDFGGVTKFYSIWFIIYIISYLIMFSSLVINMANIFQIFFSRNILLEQSMDSEFKISFFFMNVVIVMRMICEYFMSGEYWSWNNQEIWLLILLMVMSCYFFLQKSVWQILFKIVIIILSFFISVFVYLNLL